MGVQVKCEKTEPYLNRHGQPKAAKPFAWPCLRKSKRTKVINLSETGSTRVPVQNPAPCSLFQKSKPVSKK